MTVRPTACVRATAVSVLLASSLLLVPLAGTAAAQPARVSPAVSAPRADGFDATALERALAEVPDGDVSAALIRVGGKGSWSGSAGVRDLRTGAPALQNARFRAGSTTKVVTAAVVLQLVAEKRVDLDAPVSRYLPDLLPPSFTEPPTVRHLLTYTSGLRPGASLGSTTEEMYAHRFETLTPEEVVAASVTQGPAHTPGERQVYGNIHYTVLGMLIEAVTDDSYEHQAAVRVLRPLGMRHTGFPGGPDPHIHGPHNRAYADIDGRATDVTEWNMSDRWAAGDMISTTADLERLVFGLFGGKIVPRSLLDRMLTVPDIDGATYGMALQRFVIDGREVWGKTGSRPGYHTVLGATRDLSRTVVYSVNAKSARDDAFPLVQRFALPAFASRP
ncbi:beta-lactamase family protein [Streptomyces cellulosae]|uniref:serine hydrolase domain-containing protein n=1 Tax=unclassified Streptomyces TaxID=2593676 RepID=UPI00109E44A5|nr:beta-lactamase family protein [Streptomyces sp. McG8]THC57974.1 class A beta-lactamase-related serine hydrolase [Streptomyces sp. Akac8]WUC42102.1 beta-lactamase family protein [Streptomyces cellulosae]